MIKLLALSIALFANTANTTVKTNTAPLAVTAKTIYDFKVESLTGGTIDFAKFKGKMMSSVAG